MTQNTEYLLNPDYHFRNDIYRVAMYSGNKVSQRSAQDWMSFVHPVQAEILLSFATPHPMSWHYDDLKSKYHLTPEQVNKMIEQYVENEQPVYTQFGKEQIIFPQNVLLTYDETVKPYSGWRNSNISFECKDIDVSSQRLFTGPQAMTLMMTSRCVTNCKYCYADKETPYVPMPTKDILRIIDEAKGMGMSYIDVIGGEVFCHKDWAVILKKLVECELTPSYISTKVPLSEKQVRALKETGYDNVVQLSLDSLDDLILQEVICSKPGYAQKMQDSIALLEQNGFKIQIDTILTKQTCNKKNLSDLYAFISSIKNLEYWEMRVPELSLYHATSFASVKASRKAIEEARAFVMEEVKPKANINILFSDDALDYSVYKGKADEIYFKGGACGALQTRLFILPDGQVSICELTYWNPLFLIGNLRQQSISEVWNSPKARAIYNHEMHMREESRCSSCKVLDFCQDNRRKCVVKVMQAYGKENWDYPDPRCTFAPEITSEMKY